MTDLVWYVSYGSNLSAERFHYYIQGGRPPGAARTYPGARDRTLPRADKAVWLPGGIYFATESQVWGGGRALYDPAIPGEAAARAYLITRQQFSDVAVQEMYRDPGMDLDIAEVVSAGRVQVGNGRYETLVYVGHNELAPLLTFTAPWGIGDVPLLSPSDKYLRMLGQGLRDAHGWDSEKAANYLANLPGARGTWTPEQITSLIVPGSPDGELPPRL